MDSLILTLQGFLQPWLLFLAEDPALRLLQLGMLFLGVVVIFFVFFTTRDILLRTHSFWYMVLSIVLVAALPVIGFFLYLLIRPARTLRERELSEAVALLVSAVEERKIAAVPTQKAGIVKKEKKNETKDEDISL